MRLFSRFFICLSCRPAPRRSLLPALAKMRAPLRPLRTTAAGGFVENVPGDLHCLLVQRRCARFFRRPVKFLSPLPPCRPRITDASDCGEHGLRDPCQ